MTYRCKKLLDFARGLPCVLCHSVGTTVAAHSNALEHGRGASHKAPDYYVAYVCGRCHDLIDGRAGGLSKEEKREMWTRAFVKSVAVWFERGLVNVGQVKRST